jgi:hypothetical protein
MQALAAEWAGFAGRSKQGTTVTRRPGVNLDPWEVKTVMLWPWLANAWLKHQE